MHDELGELCARVIFQCIWAFTVVKVGNLIARHQDLIIRRVLQLQDLFRLPTCVRILTEDDHEIPEKDMKACAGLLVFWLFISAPMTIGTLLGGISWGGTSRSQTALRLVLVLAAVDIPFSIVIWIVLATSARRRANYRRRRAGPALARSSICQETKAEEGMVANEPADGAEQTDSGPASRSMPEQQQLRWAPGELVLWFL